MFDRIDHVGIAVEDLDGALALYEGTFGMTVVHRETVEAQGVEAVLLDVGENHVELMRPLGPDTPVGKFVDKRGYGIHHVAYQVTRRRGRARTHAARTGLRLIDEARARDPRLERRVPAPGRGGRC
jgi:methylmalonyl-CoA epimerase